MVKAELKETETASNQVKQEQTSLGFPTGIEEDESGDIGKPFDPEDIDVVTKPMTIDLLIARIKSRAINLQPDFQRRWGVWDQNRQSRLIESLMLRIPVPSLYAAEDANEDWEIVDGVQRLYSIARFVEPTVIDESPLVLTELATLPVFNGRTYETLPPKLQRRLRETELVVHVIRKGTPSAVKYSIFERINTGSVVLSAQELRHAITPGPARRILEEWAATSEFQRAVDGSVRGDRMGDRELVLRFAAFRLSPAELYRVANIDRFLLEAMEQLNLIDASRLRTLQEEFIGAMKAAREIFGSDAFRKRYERGKSRYPINKALFEAISVNLANFSKDQIAKLIERRDVVQDAFIGLCADRAFDSAISQGTGDIAKVRRRFSMVARMFKEVAANA